MKSARSPAVLRYFKANWSRSKLIARCQGHGMIHVWKLT
jgi:hypothetical protein